VSSMGGVGEATGGCVVVDGRTFSVAGGACGRTGWLSGGAVGAVRWPWGAFGFGMTVLGGCVAGFGVGVAPGT
jgi:hypothetical protein